MQETLFGHRISPEIFQAIEAAKEEYLLQKEGRISLASTWRLPEGAQLDLIEEFGEMFGERLHTTYSQKELRAWIEATANRIVRSLGKKLALQEVKR